MEKCEGIILRQSDYRESDKIVVMFTREYGKMGMVAYGAKKTRSRLAAATEPFIHGHYSFFGGTKGLVTLQQGEIINQFTSIRENIFKAAYACYVVELIDKATEEREKNPFLFELAERTLHDIDEGRDPQILTNIFEMKMLNILGHYPVMDKCAICGAEKGQFDFSTYSNGIVCHRCFEKDPHRLHLPENIVKLLRLFYIFQLDRLGNIDVKPENKQILQKAIDTYYDENTGIYLKTRKFLRNISDWEDMLKKPDSD